MRLRCLHGFFVYTERRIIVEIIAMVMAGGSGSRMHQNIPKQFLTVDERPVIVYTLEVFQKHPEVDTIAAVCIEGWENVLDAYAKQFGITKLKHIITGGASAFESIRNGVFELEKHFSPDDMVLIHDGIRPMVSPEIISECIRVGLKYGNAITAIPCPEAMMITDDGVVSRGTFANTSLKRTQTPHAFYLKDICALHRRAIESGIKNSLSSCSLVEELGGHVYFSSGSEKNLKLTTLDDIDIFKALLRTERSSWLK